MFRTDLLAIIRSLNTVFTAIGICHTSYVAVILIDRRWHSSIIDVRSFRGAECDTDHYLVVAQVRERLAVRKQASQKSDGGRFNLRKLNDLEVRKQYHIEITNRFAALENVREDEDINRGWGALKKISKHQLQRV